MGRRDARRDVWCRAAEVRGQRPWDGCRARQRESDAWGGVRRGAMADARRGLRQMPGADAEKLAGRERAFPVRGGSRSAGRA